jgi:hypothetical protein
MALAFGRKNPDFNLRRSPREAVMLAGSAMSVTRSRSVVVHDISANGAALGGRDLPPAGDDVVMVVGPVDSFGRVVWRSGDNCGITFDQPIRAEQIEQMKESADWAEVTGWDR